MITKDTLPQMLKMSGFASRKGIFSKTFGAATLEVDTAKETIGYPKAEGLIVNEQQTCNFSANENFVVLECVHRLLEKGYKPEHIELEPKWKLGHGASGGRADILIKDNTGKPLLIIECKTPGREFDKAWRNTLQDGDQLFGYVEQIKATEFLCLYASDFEGGILSYKSNIIAHRDNDKYLADNPLFKSYRMPPTGKSVLQSGVTPTSWTLPPRGFLRTISSPTTSARTNTPSPTCTVYPPLTSRKNTMSLLQSCASTMFLAGKTPLINW